MSSISRTPHIFTTTLVSFFVSQWDRDTLVTYEFLMELLSPVALREGLRPINDRKRLHSYLQSAKRITERDHEILFDCKIGEGVFDPQKHNVVSHVHRSVKKTMRAGRRTLRKTRVASRYVGLTRDQLDSLYRVESGMTAIIQTEELKRGLTAKRPEPPKVVYEVPDTTGLLVL